MYEFFIVNILLNKQVHFLEAFLQLAHGTGLWWYFVDEPLYNFIFFGNDNIEHGSFGDAGHLHIAVKVVNLVVRPPRRVLLESTI